MRKSILGVFLALIVMLLLSGCQSTREDMPVPDRFVGVNVAILSGDAPDEAARGEPHEPDGQYFMIPFAVSADGERYTKAVRSGAFESESFNLSAFDNAVEYSAVATLYLGGQAEENASICIERIYQRSDGTCYAMNTGYYLDTPLMAISLDDWAETRKVTDEDGKPIDETTRISLTILDAPLPTSAPL